MSETLDRPPRNRLPLEPQIESPDDIGRAFEELAWMKSIEETAKAVCDQRIQLAKKDVEKKCVTTIEDTKVTFADRRRALENAILDWSDAHREIVLADGGKTRKFTHGQVSFKNSTPKLGLADGTKPEDVLAIADKKCPHKDGLLAWLQMQLASIQLTQNVSAAILCNVKLTLDKQALWAAFKSGLVSEKELNKLGLVVEKAEEFVGLKVTEYTVESESRETAAA